MWRTLKASRKRGQTKCGLQETYLYNFMKLSQTLIIKNISRKQTRANTEIVNTYDIFDKFFEFFLLFFTMSAYLLLLLHVKLGNTD